MHSGLVVGLQLKYFQRTNKNIEKDHTKGYFLMCGLSSFTPLEECQIKILLVL